MAKSTDRVCLKVLKESNEAFKFIMPFILGSLAMDF
jgi:hypothetical protein